MGLIEKRLIRDAKETWLPGEQEEMRSIAGSEVVVDIDWATFESDEPALRNLQHLGVRKVVNAFRLICADDLGKEAVRGIKRVFVTNVKDAKEGSVNLENETVTLTGAFGKGFDGTISDTQIAKTLERML